MEKQLGVKGMGTGADTLQVLAAVSMILLPHQLYCQRVLAPML